jgi:hypothetical protein
MKCLNETNINQKMLKVFVWLKEKNNCALTKSTRVTNNMNISVNSILYSIRIYRMNQGTKWVLFMKKKLK